MPVNLIAQGLFWRYTCRINSLQRSSAEPTGIERNFMPVNLIA